MFDTLTEWDYDSLKSLPGLATWDRPTALRTAKELRGLDPARLAVGHGNVAVSPGAAMDAAIAKLDGR